MTKELDCPICGEVVKAQCRATLMDFTWIHLVGKEGILPDNAEDIISTSKFKDSPEYMLFAASRLDRTRTPVHSDTKQNHMEMVIYDI